ncbi:hypothetical protein SAMN05216410_1119 [Sanguibacter gelidistatuariae]|uniref:Uncharacterized protein n=1 Tax=Sanguibacter gelidistatuariae TaxID=1814289 RepID=A0A1G6HL60_9MICO|nr:hypothetical protein [Sanguibacter gelidistatuariae]SDB94924.1 hypothetical protein SAMN05216410_1119 [Sanguibacter gelidistatuariae]
MTLLHTMLSSRLAGQRTVEVRSWPAGTVLTSCDVHVAGVSMADLARASDTPMIHITSNDAAHSGAQGQPRRLTIVVVRVDAAIPSLYHQSREVWVDAELEGCLPVLSAVRLLGRHSSAHVRRYRMRPDRSGNLSHRVHLPDDLHRGDLLAIPCLAPFALEDIQR